MNPSNILRSGPLGSALYSPCERFRYRLDRPLYPKSPGYRTRRGAVNFILLNPSTATESENDPTITRCIDYAFRWGYGHVIITNIFALRSTDPKVLYRTPEAIGEDNDSEIDSAAEQSGFVVCGWGIHGEYQGRGNAVMERLQSKHRLFCWRLTSGGQPNHPLYLKANLMPRLIETEEDERFEKAAQLEEWSRMQPVDILS